jgi:hypothetical protein
VNTAGPAIPERRCRHEAVDQRASVGLNRRWSMRRGRTSSSPTSAATTWLRVENSATTVIRCRVTVVMQAVRARRPATHAHPTATSAPPTSATAPASVGGCRRAARRRGSRFSCSRTT